MARILPNCAGKVFELADRPTTARMMLLATSIALYFDQMSVPS